jgi:outer membrane lipoprotein-sorting protein
MRRRYMMRRAYIISTGALLGFVSLVLALLMSQRTSTPAFGQPSQVLHVRASMDEFDGQGVRQSTTLHELWFDPVTMDTKYVTSDVNGAHKVTQLRHGRTVIIYDHNNNYSTVNEAATDDSPMLGVASRFLWYKEALQSGQLQHLGDGEVRGSQATKVKGQGRDMAVVSWLDKQTLLPLEEVFSTGKAPLETARWTYSLVEHRSRDQTPPDAFSLSVPSDANSVFSQYMSVSQAAAFTESDTYYLGDSYDGLPLFAITYRRLTGPEYLIGGKPQTSVDITYFRDGIKIALVQQPAAQHRQRESAPGVPWIGEKVQVDGHDATLYAQPNEVDLDIRLGNTIVTIFGRDRQQVLKAAAALRKLNSGRQNVLG